MSFQNFANGKMSGISKIVHLNILTFSVIIITIRGLPAVALTGYSEAQARILNKYYFRACPPSPLRAMARHKSKF